jgi:hypothetical protein
MHANCPIVTKSHLQTEVCLLATEAEHTGLLYALREAILPIMLETIDEMRNLGFKVHPTIPKVHCQVFEDNSGALEMARIHKGCPRTKHLNVKLRHFQSYVEGVAEGEGPKISIHKIATKEQPANIFTNPLPYDAFIKHRATIVG